MPKFLKCLRFDLTNPFTGHAEFLTDLFQSMIDGVANTETHTQDALLPQCEIAKCFANHSLQGAELGCRLWIDAVWRIDQIAQGRATVLADWSIERDRLLHH